jgi:hypothetical protein
MTVGEFCNRQVVFARRRKPSRTRPCCMRDLHVGTIAVDGHDGRRLLSVTGPSGGSRPDEGMHEPGAPVG